MERTAAPQSPTECLWIDEVYAGGMIRTGYRVERWLFEAQSPFQKIEIVETAFFGRMLLLDGCVMTTERDEFIYHEMIVHVPMLAHAAPKNVLIIGGGDGGTVREVLRHPGVESVVLCEIDGRVMEACREFLPAIAGRLDDPRVDIQVRDGVEYVAGQKNRFDLVLIDSTDPVGPGEGLFTEAFYRNVLEALADDGIMVNQSESPVANPREIALIYRLLRSVFPAVFPYVAPIPTYPGGCWSWAFCTRSGDPLRFNEALAERLEQETRYYNRSVHRAAFALPNFVRQLTEAGSDPASGRSAC